MCINYTYILICIHNTPLQAYVIYFCFAHAAFFLQIEVSRQHCVVR